MKLTIFAGLLLCSLHLSIGAVSAPSYKTGFMPAGKLYAESKARLRRLADDCAIIADRIPMLAVYARDVAQACTDLETPASRFLCDQEITTFHKAYVAIQ